MEDLTIVTNNKKNQIINEQISAPNLRVISNDGDQLGIITTKDALERAYRDGFDLVLISPNAEPPVARIMDYNKYKFDMMKKQKEMKKNQKVTELKELRFSVNIDTNDLNTKARHAKKFIENGDKVKITIKLFGRERGRPEVAVNVLNDFFDEFLKDIAQKEREPKIEGRNVLMIISPLSLKK